MRTRNEWWRALVSATTMVVASLALAPISLAAAAGLSSSHLVPYELLRAGNTSTEYLVTAQWNECNALPCAALYRVRGAASQVSRVSLPPYQTSADSNIGSIREIFFATPRIGYVLEDSSNLQTPGHYQLYRTTNGAVSWSRASLPNGLEFGSLVATARTVYVMTFQCHVPQGKNILCLDYHLARSGDGGQLWSSASIPNGNDYGYGFLGNVAVSGSSVWLTEGAEWSYLVSSHNGGKTFSLRTVPDLISAAGCSLTATSGTSLWAECPGGMEERFAFSDDGGTTWHLIQPRTQFMGTGGGAFDPVNSQLAFIAESSADSVRTLARVTQHATRVSTVGPMNGCTQVEDLTFLNARQGLAICIRNYGISSTPSALLRSVDGGKTWVKVTT